VLVNNAGNFYAGFFEELTPEQIERYLRPTLRGERADAYAVTEGGAGSDSGAIAGTAVETAGGWHLSTEKWFVTTGDVADAGKAIALALGIGLGALGAGVGIGNIFGSMIQSVARQPELRGELQGIMWLGFALTEAVVFYGLIGGLLAYVLI